MQQERLQDNEFSIFISKSGIVDIEISKPRFLFLPYRLRLSLNEVSMIKISSIESRASCHYKIFNEPIDQELFFHLLIELVGGELSSYHVLTHVFTEIKVSI